MKQDKDWIKAMRNALRDAELPPPAGGWERLQRELGGAAPGPEVSGTKPRGSVWRIYRPRIAAAAAAQRIQRAIAEQAVKIFGMRRFMAREKFAVFILHKGISALFRFFTPQILILRHTQPSNSVL